MMRRIRRACLVALLGLTLGNVPAHAEVPAAEGDVPTGYGVAHVVLRRAEDWQTIIEAVCRFAPRAVIVSGVGPPTELPCAAVVIETTAPTESAVMIDDDAYFVLRDDPSGETEGALHRERRARRAARWFFALAETYVPMASPREELVLQADDPVDAVLAADSPITDSAAGSVRPFGGARVFASGVADESSFRAYWVDASGIKALGPASPVSALPGSPDAPDSPSE